MKIGMVVLAGGIGKRIGRPFPKQFLLLGGKPLIVHVLEKARIIPAIERIVITCPEAHLDETRRLIANHGFDDRFGCIVGGASRQESVYRGLAELADTDSVIIHEAVRPLVTAAEFETLIAAPDPNAMFGIPIPFTVLKGHEYVEDLLERDELVNVQLPQKFDRAALMAAHEAARRDNTVFTEDASLFHRYAGSPVRILPGSERNIKITVPTDIVTAEAIYADVIGRGR
ncbi:MAG: 2-C-methyl-D-erythritol 4-phosphate cytidylyltransferase [Chloroflexota bacterium]